MGIFFYLEKAYDTTWQYEGSTCDCLCGNLAILIRNFLALRHFHVWIKTTYFSLHTQDLGIPQSSILVMTHFGVKVNCRS